MTHRHWIAGWLLVLSACAEAPAPDTPSVDPEVQLRDAHDAYVEGDPARMADAVHGVLVHPATTTAMRDNAVGLLESAWAERNGRLPSAARLPDELDSLTVDVIRAAEPEALVFRVVVRGEGSPSAVRDVRIEDGAGDPIADRALSLGTWTEEDGEFELESPGLASLPESVLALVVSTASGAHRYWVPVDALTCSAAPTVHRPIPGSTVSPTPELSWEDFISPEHQPYEGRTLGVWLARRTADGLEPAHFAFFSGTPPTSLDLDAPLEPGAHWLALTYGETRTFGPLRLRRLCRTGVPFDVSAR